MLNVYDYLTGTNAFRKFAVDDLLFVEYKCLIKESPVSYWTDSNYFSYILTGHKKYSSKDQEITLTKGDAVFVTKGAYTAERFDNEEFCALLIFLSDDFIKSLLEKYPEQLAPRDSSHDGPYGIVPLEVNEILSSYFQSLLSYFAQPVSPPRELLKIKFEELILNILTSDENRLLASYLRKTYQSSKVSIRQIMESSFMYNMSMEEYARLCARSLSAFKNDFFEIYKTTPGKWLLEMRLHYAKCLMEATEDSVSDIAYKSGFKNTTHFVRVFKEKYRIPPLQYRLKAMKESELEEI